MFGNGIGHAQLQYRLHDFMFGQHFQHRAACAAFHGVFFGGYQIIRLQIFTGMELTLPRTLDYLTATFTRDARKDLEKAER